MDVQLERPVLRRVDHLHQRRRRLVLVQLYRCGLNPFFSRPPLPPSSLSYPYLKPETDRICLPLFPFDSLLLILSLKLHLLLGSTLWIYGDQVNDHGPFSVSFNSSSSSSSSSSSPSPVVLSGASGCGGAFGKTCEKLGTLAFVVSGLPEGQHRVKLTNLAGQNGSYFGSFLLLLHLSLSLSREPVFVVVGSIPSTCAND